MKPFHLYITTNSPGELTAWVKPIVKTLKEQCPNSRITLLLVPCQYASGEEKRIAEAIPGIEDVWPVRKTLTRLLLPTTKPTHGAIISLGGDPQYAKLWGKKLAIPSYLYTEHNLHLKGFEAIFKHTQIGNLMYDHIQQAKTAVAEAAAQHPTLQKHPIVFFSGSRPQHFTALFPYFCTVIKHLQEHYPKETFGIQLSPFLDEALIQETLNKTPHTHISIIETNSQHTLSAAKAIVTIPGTNTAEAMYNNTPMIVTLPLNRPDLIIFDGLLGIIGKIPMLGYLLKSIALRILKSKIKYVSHPNKKENKEIVPELIGNYTEKEMAELIKPQLEEKQLLAIKNRLQAIIHKTGTAKHIVTTILENI